MHTFEATQHLYGWSREGSLRTSIASVLAGRSGVRCHMDVVTIAVVGVILVSYLVGSLTSSVETERELPHRY
jgi:hypothetical protein